MLDPVEWAIPELFTWCMFVTKMTLNLGTSVFVQKFQPTDYLSGSGTNEYKSFAYSLTSDKLSGM